MTALFQGIAYFDMQGLQFSCRGGASAGDVGFMSIRFGAGQLVVLPRRKRPMC